MCVTLCGRVLICRGELLETVFGYGRAVKRRAKCLEDDGEGSHDVWLKNWGNWVARGSDQS